MDHPYLIVPAMRSSLFQAYQSDSPAPNPHSRVYLPETVPVLSAVPFPVHSGKQGLQQTCTERRVHRDTDREGLTGLTEQDGKGREGHPGLSNSGFLPPRPEDPRDKPHTCSSGGTGCHGH